MPDSTHSAAPDPATRAAADPDATASRPPDHPTATRPPDAHGTVGATPEQEQASAARSAQADGRYVLGPEISRGGMGVVYRAADTVLGREVAVKVLHEKYAPDSGTARRFADEARIAGQLQHPNIPAVHDLGTLPDGRPFLAMKLIKGRTLDELLAARPDPGHDRGRFVAAFEQVCQAVAYAHAHAVIHRDLKPANVMVGAYGEVQVMDWGLAKVLGSRTEERAEADETTAGTAVVSLRDSDDLMTRAGSVLGTPAFMPPEQAVGAVATIDTRSDVFGLGAVLAVVLTGQPPYVSGSSESTRVMAARGDVAACLGRLDGCGADPVLVGLCRRCLSPRPEDRPADAGEVAAAVAELRAAADERARQADLSRLKTEVEAAEQRKRRRALTLAAGALLAVLAAGVVGTTVGLLRADSARTAEAAERGKAEKARDDLAAALEAEGKARAAADESYELAREAVLGVTVDIPDILRRAEFAQAAQRQVVTVLADAMEKQLKLAATRHLPDRAMHTLHVRMGDLLRWQMKWDDARKHYDAALAISERLLRTETAEKDRAKLLHATGFLRLGYLSRDRAQFANVTLEHYKKAEVLQREVLTAPTTGEVPRAETQLVLSTTLYDTATTLDGLHAFDDALKLCEEAVTLRREAADAVATPATRSAAGLLADAQILLGEIQFKRGENAKAEAAMRAATATFEKELARDPFDPNLRRRAAAANRAAGDLLLFLKRYDDARPFHARDIELSQGLLRIPEIAAAETDLSRAFYRSGTLALKAGDPAGAKEFYRKCVALRREVVAAQPENDYARMALAAALARLGEHAEAVGIMMDMRSRFPRSRYVATESAAVFGLAAESLLAGRKEEDLSFAERARVWMYRDIALSSLKRSVVWWTWRDLVRLETDPDFDPLRGEPRFREVVELVKKQIEDEAKRGREKNDPKP